MTRLRIAVVAGEASGDQLGASLLRALAARGIACDAFGVGGDALAAEGVAIAERVPHELPPNPHNAHYLATKRDRSGHLLK